VYQSDYPLAEIKGCGILFPVMAHATEKKSTPPYVVKKSKAGLGLFALREYKRGDFIIEYTGEHISEEEANRRGGQYLFTLTKDITVDGKGRENTARYINHSCKPNAEAETDEDEMKIRILAKKKILPGEEILYDYGKEHWEYHIKPYGCRCAPCTTRG
jgi:SET domain-containing protein